MKLQTKYVCEICEKVYDKKIEALECEKYHPIMDEIELYDIKYKAKYTPSHTDVPEYIHIKIGNWIYKYMYIENKAVVAEGK